MQLAITFRNFDASEALKDHTRERLERLGRNLDRACSAHVVLSLERHLHHADLTFSTRPLVLRAKRRARTLHLGRSGGGLPGGAAPAGQDRNKHHHRRAWVHHQQVHLRRGGRSPSRSGLTGASGSVSPRARRHALLPGAEYLPPHPLSGWRWRGPSAAQMKIAEFLSPQAVIPELQGRTKPDVLRELPRRWRAPTRRSTAAGCWRCCVEREKLGTTGIGEGVAIPHGQAGRASPALRLR